jgi:hypothetical protein
LQEAGLKVKEYELLRKNFSDSGNFGEQQNQEQRQAQRQQQQQQQVAAGDDCAITLKLTQHNHKAQGRLHASASQAAVSVLWAASHALWLALHV